MGLFDWLRRRPKSAAIPEALWQKTLANYPFLAALAVDEQKDLKMLAERFLADKEFSAAGGLELNDDICTAIAAQGCLPVLRLGLAAYGDWVGIVVYPDEFVVPRQIADADGVVHEYDDVLAGEAWQGGPLVLSWHDVQQAGDGDDGYSVVIHEFAHKLDMLNGEADGVPALHSGLSEENWIAVLDRAWEDFCRRVDGGEETILDPYAAESPAEFFAVLSEAFFLIPDVVAGEYPALYELFCRYYRQAPLTRLTKADKAASTAAS